MMKRTIWLLVGLLLAVGVVGCSDDDYDDRALWEEIEKIQAQIDEMNAEIASIKVLISAVETGKLILNVVETENGYKIIFNDNTSITLNHGENPPIVGIKLFEGKYYWTITTGDKTEWLTDQAGNKLPVLGETPILAVDSENYWTVNGERISDGKGGFVKAKGEDGDSFLKGLEESDDEVTITLADGSVVRLKKVVDMSFSFDTAPLELGYGQSVTLEVAQSGVKFTTITKPDGWKVKLEGNELTILSPVRPNDYCEKTGEVSVIAVGESSTIIVSVDVAINPNLSGGGAGESEWEEW